MIRKGLITLCLIACLMVGAPVAAEPAQPFDAPGMALHITGSEVVATGVDGNGASITADTPFVWGSVSKALAGAVVEKLAEQGAIQLDDKVQPLLPSAAELLGNTPVTVRDLLNHTSGLPHDLSVTDDWSRQDSALETVGSLSRPDAASDPGTFQYSSLNYLVLQALVEQVTHRPYADTLREVVLEPAGATGVLTTQEEYQASVPPGHIPFFTAAKPQQVGVDEAGLGYGYLAGSVTDLSAFAWWWMQEIKQNPPATAPASQGKEYGSGLFKEEFDGQEIWWHAGAVPGYYTFIGMNPAEDKAVVVLTNRYGELEADKISQAGRSFLAEILVDPNPDWFPLTGNGYELTVLGIMSAIVIALLVLVAVSTIRLFRSQRLHGLKSMIVIGTLLLAASVIGMPIFFGASFSTIALWAPDVALLFWTIVAELILVIMLGIIGRKFAQ